MKIISVAIGNETKAFVEDKFVENLNIISSDDNNKGKTILIQGMMYALGNIPTFPVSFDYKNYYYIVEFENNGVIYKVCRYLDDFIVKTGNKTRIFENTSEFRRYWDKEIQVLPRIIKNNKITIVHPELYLQLYFVGQDKKNTSTISNAGYYNKNDFTNMIFSICGATQEFNEYEYQDAKKVLNELEHQKKIILKENKILKSKRNEISFFSKTVDKEQFESNLTKIENVNSELTDLKKERNRNVNRRIKCETAIFEIRSLNRELESGEIVCLECGSVHIGYKSSSRKEYIFDITTSDLRKDIIKSLEYKILDYEEEVLRITTEMEIKQGVLKSLLSVEEVSLESLLFYKDQILNSNDSEKRLLKIDEQIHIYKEFIGNFNNVRNVNATNQKEIFDKMIVEMNKLYKDIDSEGTLVFDNLFTKKTETYSGSEATVFYLIKMYIHQQFTNHSNPIIIDSFRAEDLSTEKEKKFLDLFSNLENQIILTTTLKEEEVGKYDKEEFHFLNHIDYSSHRPSSILSDKYVDYFKGILSELIG